jgi:hypothetical protein
MSNTNNSAVVNALAICLVAKGRASRARKANTEYMALSTALREHGLPNSMEDIVALRTAIVRVCAR